MKTYVSDLIKHEIVEDNPITCIVAGTGSGKSTFIEGIHDESYPKCLGLVDKYNTLYLTSRRSKVDEIHKSNPCLEKSIENAVASFRENQNFARSVACTFSHLIQYCKKYNKNNSNFWSIFDLIVIDEFHSIVTDSSFTESQTILDFLETVYDNSIKGRKNDDVQTKIVLFSATPQPFESFLEKLNAKTIDLSDKAIWVKPQYLSFEDKCYAYPKIQEALSHKQTVVYYSTFFDNYACLVELARSAGISDADIIIDISDKERLKVISDIYPLVNHYMDEYKEHLSYHQRILPCVKLLITNSKNKEGINIKSPIDLLVLENHYFNDIKQICGRIRKGVKHAIVINDARQFKSDDKIYEEQYLYSMLLSKINQYLQETIFKINSGFQSIVEDKKLTDCINYFHSLSGYLSFNFFLSKFEINECYVEYKKHYEDSIAEYDRMIQNLQSFLELPKHDRYFDDIIISVNIDSTNVQPQRDTRVDFIRCCQNNDYTIDTELNYELLSKIAQDLNTLRSIQTPMTKEFKNYNALFKYYGYRYITIGKHSTKDAKRYRIERIADVASAESA